MVNVTVLKGCLEKKIGWLLVKGYSSIGLRENNIVYAYYNIIQQRINPATRKSENSDTKFARSVKLVAKGRKVILEPVEALF